MIRRRDPNALDAPVYAYARGRPIRRRQAAASAEPEDWRRDQKQLALWAGAVPGVPILFLFVIFWPIGIAFSSMLLLSPIIIGALWPFENPQERCLSLIFQWLFGTYAVWAMFSLTSFNMLGVLALPVLLPYEFERYMRFWPFIGPPLEYALIFSSLIFVFARRLAPAHLRRWIGSVFFNVVLLACTLFFAEGHRRLLVKEDLKLHHPSCVETDTFFNSLMAGWEDFQFHVHGSMVEDGVTYLWSYREMRFVPMLGLQGWSCA